jgi:hypothetical protein
MYRVLGFAGLQIGFASYKYTITWSFISKLGKYNKLFCVQRVHSPQIRLSCSCFATMCFMKCSQAGGEASKFLHWSNICDSPPPLSMLRLSASQRVLVLNLTSETRHWSSFVDWCKVTWLDWCGYRQICLADLSGTVAALHCQLQVSNHSKNMEFSKVCMAWCY